MKNKGLAFAWHTWHRLAGGVRVCSWRHHEFYVDYERPKLWMMTAHVNQTISGAANHVMCDAREKG